MYLGMYGHYPPYEDKGPKKCDRGVVQLRPGLLCYREELDNLSRLYIDRCRRYDGRGFPASLFAESVAAFLAIPFVGDQVVAVGASCTIYVTTEHKVKAAGELAMRPCMKPEPLYVCKDLPPIAQVAASLFDDTTWGLTFEGKLVCPLTRGNKYYPPDNFPKVKALACGEEWTACILADGQYKGLGPRQRFPTSDLGPLVKIACGGRHVCTLDETGKMVCFGASDYGQLSVPEGIGEVIDIAAGNNHSACCTKDGKLYVFGDSVYDQCQLPTGIGPVLAVAAGDCHTCALEASGRLTCFGADMFGQSTKPPWLDEVVFAAAGNCHTVAVKPDGTFMCFGDYCWQGRGVKLPLKPMPLRLRKRPPEENGKAKVIDDRFSGLRKLLAGEEAKAERLRKELAEAEMSCDQLRRLLRAQGATFV